MAPLYTISNTPVTSEHRNSFVHLLVEHQPRLFAFIRTLIPHRDAAEDVYQNTCAVLWEKFEAFEQGTSFIHWALEVARYEVLSHRRDHARDRLQFGEEYFDRLQSEAAAECEDVSDVKAAFEHCLDEMAPENRQLLMQRYEPNAVVSEIAESLGCPVQTVYTRLKRIRVTLFQCVQRTLRKWGRADV